MPEAIVSVATTGSAVNLAQCDALTGAVVVRVYFSPTRHRRGA